MSHHRFELEIGDEDYPEHLAQTPHAPARLFGIGDPTLLGPGLAVIGARKATPSGVQVTEMFAGWAARAGYSIISGAAIGCDQAAHRAALQAGGATVAVLGCGADVDYPRGAGELLDAVRERGCVVSELEWGRQPTRWTFHRRNRIIAALATALLVVEAGVPSGTFLTADFAAEYGRDVLAVPGSILSPESRGPNRLIRQGARPITEVDDLAAELLCLLGPPRNGSTAQGPCRDEPDPVYCALAACPARPDDVAYALHLSISEVVRTLSRLSAAGLTQRFADGRYGVLPRVGAQAARYNEGDG